MSTQLRTMRVCDYVDVPFDSVCALLRAPGLTEDLQASLALAVALDDEPEVTAGALEALTDGVARIHVSWRFMDPTAGERTGEGTILVLALQTGRTAVTEVLAAIDVDDAFAPEASAATRRFLDDFARRLATAAAQFPKSHPSPQS